MQILVMIIIVEMSDIADCRDFDSNSSKDSISVAVPAQSLRNASTHGVWCTNMAGQTQNSDNLCPGASKQTRNKPPKTRTWNLKMDPFKRRFLLETHHFQLPLAVSGPWGVGNHPRPLRCPHRLMAWLKSRLHCPLAERLDVMKIPTFAERGKAKLAVILLMLEQTAEMLD